MKMKTEHFVILEKAIKEVLKERVDIRKFYSDNKMSEKRFRWDLLYMSEITIGDGKGVQGLPLYTYLDDTHIDTALRKITNTK